MASTPCDVQAARAVQWNAHGVQAKERGVSSLQMCIPIVLIMACMRVSQTDFGGGMLSQCRGRHTCRCGCVLNLRFALLYVHASTEREGCHVLVSCQETACSFF
jgi:hypothetical protein